MKCIKEILSNYSPIIFFALFVLVLGLTMYSLIQEYIQRAECTNRTPEPQIYELYTLYGQTSVEASGSLDGSFFLGIGNVTGNTNSSTKYIIKYAYKTGLGIKFVSEEITDNIYIQEVDDNRATIKRYIPYQYYHSSGECGLDYGPNTLTKIITVPKGTIYRDLELDIRK